MDDWSLDAVIVNADDKTGHAETSYDETQLNARHWKLITMLAGPMAEESITGKMHGVGFWDDFMAAEELALEIDKCDPDAVMERYRAMAEKFVSVHRKQIIAVAEFLRSRGRLDGWGSGAYVWKLQLDAR